MSQRRRRHPNGRFWALLTTLVVIVAAVIFVTHRHHAAAPPVAMPKKPPAFSLGRWTVAPISLSQPIQGFSAVLTPHTIWLLGGMVNGQGTTLVQKITISGQNHLNPVQDISPGLPVSLHDAAAVFLPGRIVLLGGSTVVSSASVFRLPLPALNPATTLTPLPLPLSDAAATTHDGAILIIGGHNTATPSNTIWSYTSGHPVTVWGHLPIGVRYAAVASTSRTLYVVGGLSASGPSNQAVAYDLTSKTMTKLPPYPIAVEYPDATIIDGHLVVAGGETDAGWISAAYWYDAAKNVWKSAPALPEPGGHGAFVTLPSGTAVWLGGDSPSGAVGAVWTIRANIP